MQSSDNPENSIKAFILAAGRGERMRPLTDALPKPMLRVQGKPLMQWQMEAVARAGVQDVVINTAWLGDCISDYFGSRFAQPLPTPDAAVATSAQQIRIAYSQEGIDFGGALETAGGIVRALPHLSDVFWVLAGDVFAPAFVFSDAAVRRFATSKKLAHLWLVPNPEHNPGGDFGLAPRSPGTPGDALLALNHCETQYTYSTIGLFRRTLFAPPYCDIPVGNPQGVKAKLAPILRAAMDDARVTAELYTGNWTDVGTPERLALLNNPPIEKSCT